MRVRAGIAVVSKRIEVSLLIRGVKMTLNRLLVNLLFIAPAWSSVVYTNIGANDVYTSSYTAYGGAFVAAQLNPVESGPLETISMRLERNGFGLPPELVVSLRGPDTI